MELTLGGRKGWKAEVLALIPDGSFAYEAAIYPLAF